MIRRDAQRAGGAVLGAAVIDAMNDQQRLCQHYEGEQRDARHAISAPAKLREERLLGRSSHEPPSGFPTG